jgi:hypothetical protein
MEKSSRRGQPSLSPEQRALTAVGIGSRVSEDVAARLDAYARARGVSRARAIAMIVIAALDIEARRRER